MSTAQIKNKATQENNITRDINSEKGAIGSL